MTADSPVTPGRLADLLSDAKGGDVRTAIDELKAQYDEAGHSFTIVELAGGFQIATRRPFAPWIRKFHQSRATVRLSQAGLETLAIIAFKQPLTRVEVDNIRGVSSGGVLHTLMEHNLVRIVGRSDGVGKPMLFGTTREFLTLFGLKSLADLPKPKELEELMSAVGVGHTEAPSDAAESGAHDVDGTASPDRSLLEVDDEESLAEESASQLPAETVYGQQGTTDDTVDAPEERESVG